MLNASTDKLASLNNRNDIIVPSPNSNSVLPNITTERFSLSFSPAADSKESSSEFYESLRSGGNSRIKFEHEKHSKKSTSSSVNEFAVKESVLFSPEKSTTQSSKLKTGTEQTKKNPADEEKLNGDKGSEKSSEIRKDVDSDTDSSSGFKIEVEKPAPKAATKKRARKSSDESSDDDFKPKPHKEAPAKAKKTAASRKKIASEECGGAAKMPSKPKAKSKKKLSSDEVFSLSDIDAPASQSARQPPGCWWERLISILKNLLRKVLDNEAELVPLSPSMFLQDIKTIGVPDCDAVDHLSSNKRVKYRQTLQKNFRKRFRAEYLGALLQRPENKRIAKIVVGDVVRIGANNIKLIN
ncbi:hypothetical protein AVEN_22783-1 [Araneus ventricosus]|uniref:Uncharacterized protein n=1 Tax=Araneus ventricosus TaxID=182803 RepID=A0A4Y2EED6_ARAVE|nr:hypothetical protein AVEN_22783-1 [Araneus ventricosus]